MESAVEDHVCAVRKSCHAGHDSLGGHPFECPCVISCLRLGRDAAVQGDGSTDGGTAADQDTKRCRERGVLGKDHCSAFERIGPACSGIVDCAGYVGKGLDCIEGDGVEYSGLIIVADKDATRGKDGKKGIQVVRVGSLEPVAIDYPCTSGSGEDLKIWLGRSIRTGLSSNNQDLSSVSN